MTAAAAVPVTKPSQKCRCGAVAKHEQAGLYSCCDCYTLRMNDILGLLHMLQRILNGGP